MIIAKTYMPVTNMSRWVYANCALFVVLIAAGISLSRAFPELFYHPRLLQTLFAVLACTLPALYMVENRNSEEKKATLFGAAFLIANPILAYHLCYTIILGFARVGTLAD